MAQCYSRISSQAGGLKPAPVLDSVLHLRFSWKGAAILAGDPLPSATQLCKYKAKNETIQSNYLSARISLPIQRTFCSCKQIRLLWSNGKQL